ncbi:MAG: helix-turn-helix domain-containing protein, partial [Desulfobacterales bacterium]
VTTGFSGLDDILDGLRIGDNVVWYDDAGSLASIFCVNLLRTSLDQRKSLIYISFDHSPKSILERIGELGNSRYLTILDCFTNGKGEGSDVFQQFYEAKQSKRQCQIVKVDEPENADHVAGAFYGLHRTMKDDVRFIFDSLTGMQELWGGEDQILKFYSHACPRLYELNTIAYWIVEKDAHSQRLKAHLNKITQVAIDLSLKRGKTSLTVLKAEKRDLEILNRPVDYWNKDNEILFETGRNGGGRIELGSRLKELRTQRGLSQTELAKLVGVTPSTISQVESNLIHPSLPALFKMSEVLSVHVNYFFPVSPDQIGQVVFPASDAVGVQLAGIAKEKISSKMLTPVDLDSKTESYIIEIPPGTKLPSHFFVHKGEEMGYLISGELTLTMDSTAHSVGPGDMVYLTMDVPQQWENPGDEPAELLWIKIK